MLISKHLLAITLIAFFTTACGGGGGGGGGSDSSGTSNTSQAPSTNNNASQNENVVSNVSNDNVSTDNVETETAVTAVNSMAVKGPLANAVASLYSINTSNDDFKGELVAEGFTDTDAQLLMDVENRFLSQPFFILEYTLGEELNGSTPVIPTLRTLVSADQLLSNISVYATPLTTLAIDNAIESLSAETVVSVLDFAEAVNTSALQTKATFGLGILDDEVNIFTSSPVLSEATDQDQSLAYRTTIEVFAALAEKVQQESAALGTPIEAEALVEIFAEDMLDGALDGENNGEPIAKLTALDSNQVQAILSTDPNTLKIPGTDTLISSLVEIIVEETEQVAPNVTADALSQPTAGNVDLNAETQTPSTGTSPQVDTEVASSNPAPSNSDASGEQQTNTNPESGNETETVVDATPASVTLSWSVPTTRLNGDPLTMAELAGYEIYYYLEGDEDNGEVIAINDPAATSADITLSTTGVYNFAIATIDTNGLESDLSSPISFQAD